MKIRILGYCLLFVFLSAVMMGQDSTSANKYIVRGKIVDESTGEALVGASVSYEAGKGTMTDLDGNFSLSLPNGEYVLKVGYVGYTGMTRKVTVSGANITLKEIRMPGMNSLDEVEIAADVAKTRETPVAFSDISAKQIYEELGANNDMTMLLNSTPGAYASQQGGGPGDSRVNIRGFDQKNVAVMVDGIPVNDMENGQVYWSNWSGLAEITKKMQVQRGLGASRLALPSVGGVINIITKNVEQERFIVIKNDMGSANYHRLGIGYNSGLIKNKFGITLAGSYTEGDGIIDRTWQKTWSYFGKISYKINNKNLLVFGFNGSPQIHGQRSFAINMAFHDREFSRKNGVNADSIYALTSSNSMNKYTNSATGPRGIEYSPDWGYVNGNAVNAKVNYYHKPLFNLSYFLNVNKRLSYSNVLYLSLGDGGGTTLSTFPQYDKMGTGQLSMQGLYDANSTTPTGTLVPGQRPSSFYIYSSINQHKWAGTLSTFKYQHTQHLDFLAGLDARYYIGTHYQTPYDMLGGDYVLSTSDVNQDKNPASAIRYRGDKINYYYQSKISWLGLFGQMEYKADRISAFITVTGNQTGFQILNYYGRRDIVLSKDNIVRNAVGYGDTLYTDGVNTGVHAATGIPIVHNTDGSFVFVDNVTKKEVTIGPNFTSFTTNSPEARTNTSKVKMYTGYTVKGGLNYKLNYNNNVFLNLGHMSITPRFSNIYDRSGAKVGNVTNQLIYTAELGYGMKYKQLAVNVNGYITSWGNRPSDFALLSSKIDPETQNPLYYNVSGIDALLKGVEFDLAYKPVKFIEVKAFGMVADWRWNSEGISYVFTESGVQVDSTVFNAKGVHMGNAPQRQLGGSVRFEYRGFYIKPQFTYFDKMYAQFDPTKLALDVANNKDYRQMDSWKMPAYGLLDLFVGYTLKKDKTKIDLIASMNNVLDVVYMTDATFSVTPDKYSALNSYGWMGLGRRMNVGVKVTF